MHVVALRHADGATVRVVLRRYVLAAEVHEPDIAAYEADVLRLVGSGTGAVPTPRLIDVDPTGAHADVPALVMSHLAGRAVWEPGNRQRWCDALAHALVAVHAVPIPDGATLRAYWPYGQQSYEPPRWTERPALWERAVAIFHGDTIELPARFVHRDFHPGNVLWRRGSITGVVDWQHACAGPSVVDVGHNRLNLFFADEDLAQRFTAAWEAVSGERYHPWADVVAIVGVLDELRARPPDTGARAAIDRALAEAVASIGA